MFTFVSCCIGLTRTAATIVSRLRGLFYIVLGNFVFPIAINIAQIICVILKTSFMDEAYLQVFNIYISIIGLAFATVWTLGSRQSNKMSAPDGSTWNQDPAAQLSSRDKALNIRLVQEKHVHIDEILSSAPGEGSTPVREIEDALEMEDMKGKVMHISGIE